MATNTTVVVKDGAYAYYAQIKSPGALKYQQVEDKTNALINKEYVMEVLINTKELKVLTKKYKKGVKLFREAKQYTAEEFKARFKVEPPTDAAYETDDDGDIVYKTVKFRKYAAYNDGKATQLVKISGANKKAGTDRNGISVEQEIQDKNNKIIGGESTLIGNGSLIRIQLTVRDLNTKSGIDQQLDLYAVQVLELVEYESQEVEDGFEDEGGDFEDESDGFEDEEESTDTSEDKTEPEEDDSADDDDDF